MTPSSPPALQWRAVHKLDRDKRPILDGAGRPVVDDRAIVSACGRFSVCRITVAGVDRFEAWRCPRDRDDMGKRLGSAINGEGARAIAGLVAGEPSPQASMF